jgi:hypothetical protein
MGVHISNMFLPSVTTAASSLVYLLLIWSIIKKSEHTFLKSLMKVLFMSHWKVFRQHLRVILGQILQIQLVCWTSKPSFDLVTFLNFFLISIFCLCNSLDHKRSGYPLGCWNSSILPWGSEEITFYNCEAMGLETCVVKCEDYMLHDFGKDELPFSISCSSWGEGIISFLMCLLSSFFW